VDSHLSVLLMIESVSLGVPASKTMVAEEWDWLGVVSHVTKGWKNVLDGSHSFL
jgi:hypothetical protein